MKNLLAVAALVGLGAASLGGCLVRTRPGSQQSASQGNGKHGGCGPAHHWNGSQCVHNGNGEGNGKGKGHGKK